MRLKYYVKLWNSYMRIGILTMAQYPADTIIWIISMLIREASGFIGILAIVGISGEMGSWNLYEICMLFSMCAIIEGIGQIFFDNVWVISSVIRYGEMDIFLTRPASPFIQMLGQRMRFPAMFSIIIYISIFIWSVNQINLEFKNTDYILLLEYLICGTIINSGIYAIFNSFNFWIIQGDDIAVLIQTCREFVKYPLNLFPNAIQGVFTYIIPLGFVGYFPASKLLDKTDQ